MNKFIWILFFLLCVENNSLLASSDIDVAIGEWAPYVSANYEKFGAASEIFSHVSREIGFVSKYKFVPWKRALKMLDKREVFASFPWYKTSYRENNFILSDEPLIGSTVLIFYNKKNQSIQGMRDSTIANLKPFRFVGVRGFYYEKYLEENGYKCEYVNSSEQAFHMLYVGRADFFIEDKYVARDVIANSNLFENDIFEYISAPFMYDYLYVLFNIKDMNNNFIDKFNKHLRDFKKTYEYDKILKKYKINKEDVYFNSEKIFFP